MCTFLKAISAAIDFLNMSPARLPKGQEAETGWRRGERGQRRGVGEREGRKVNTLSVEEAGGGTDDDERREGDEKVGTG